MVTSFGENLEKIGTEAFSTIDEVKTGQTHAKQVPEMKQYSDRSSLTKRIEQNDAC